MATTIATDVEPIVDINNGDNEIESEQRINDNVDRKYLLQILFFLIGLSQLLPMNFLITADDLWRYKFRKINTTTLDLINTTTDKSELENYFESYLIIACNTPFLLVYLVSMTNFFNSLSIDLKIITSLLSTIITFIIITAYVRIDTDQYQNKFLIIILILVFIVNASATFIQAIFTSLAATSFPLKSMQSMVAGQAMSGLFAALAKIFSLIGKHTIVNNVFIFFLFANLVLISTFTLYIYVRNKPFYQSYAYVTENETNNVQMTVTIFVDIFRQIWPFCLTLMFVFWVTLSIYPSLFVHITPKDTIFGQKFLLPIACFLIFNLGDFIGRSFGRFLLMSKNHGYHLLILSLCRLLFIPIFLYCNAQPRHLSVLFSSETIFILFNAIFAITNGYLVLNVFMNAPQLITDNQYRHYSAYFLIAFLGIGLTLGSLSSPFVIDLL